MVCGFLIEWLEGLNEAEKDQGATQLGDRLDNVLVNTHKSKVPNDLMDAIEGGRVETYVSAADKSSGKMYLIKVDANPN